jgi:hypothetical protein
MPNLARGRTSDLLLGEVASPFIEALVLLALTYLGKGDKDHTDDPISFVPIFHSESIRINNLPITQRTSPEEEE